MLAYSPRRSLDFFVNAGTGFHSNDARNAIIDRRVTEARSLGFERCLVARSNLKGWKRPEGMEVVGVGGLEAAEELAFGAG